MGPVLLFRALYYFQRGNAMVNIQSLCMLLVMTQNFLSRLFDLYMILMDLPHDTALCGSIRLGRHILAVVGVR